MKNNYKNLSELERKARLLSFLINKSGGKLSKEELETIIGKTDINKQHEIIVVEDAKEFGKICTLYSGGLEHSWAGSYGTRVEAEVFVGNVEFGVNTDWEYSDNGNMSSPEIYNTVPNFDVTEKIVIHTEKHTWDHYNNNDTDETEHAIVVYLPSDVPYVMDNEVKYILENYNINGKDI